jgi:hypothetical protein
LPLSTPTTRKSYPRRKMPVLNPTQRGEPYFESIEKYQDQCVH